MTSATRAGSASRFARSVTPTGACASGKTTSAKGGKNSTSVSSIVKMANFEGAARGACVSALTAPRALVGSPAVPSSGTRGPRPAASLTALVREIPAACLTASVSDVPSLPMPHPCPRSAGSSRRGVQLSRPSLAKLLKQELEGHFAELLVGGVVLGGQATDGGRHALIEIDDDALPTRSGGRGLALAAGHILHGLRHGLPGPLPRPPIQSWRQAAGRGLDGIGHRWRRHVTLPWHRRCRAPRGPRRAR